MLFSSTMDYILHLHQITSCEDTFSFTHISLDHFVLQKPKFKTCISAASQLSKRCSLVLAMTATTISPSICTYADPTISTGSPSVDIFVLERRRKKKDIYFLTRAKIERHNIKTRLARLSHPSCTAVDHVNRRIAVGISLRVVAIYICVIRIQLQLS